MTANNNRKLKDSGIEWIGKVPANWKICKSKYCFECNKRIVGCLSDNYDRLSLTLKGVLKRDKEDNDGLQPTDFTNYQIVNKNELIFKLIDLQNVSTSRVGLSSFEGIVSPAYIILKQKNNYNMKYAEYYYLSMWMNEVFNTLGDAGVRSGINSNELLNLPIIIPSIEEKKRIADFLDNKCSKIDTLINDINKQIEVLEDYKKSLVYDCVTGKKDIIEKILNKSLKYDHINIDNPWFKVIPIGWSISKLKYKLLQNDGGMWGSDPINDDDVDAIVLRSTEQTIDGYWRIKDPASRYIDNKNNLSYYMIKDKDLLVTKSSGSKLHIGKTTIANKDIENMHYFYSNFIQRLHTKDEINAKYVWYFMNSSLSREQFVYMQNSTSGIGNINSNDINSLYIVVPPKEEQMKIVKYLDVNFTKINNLLNYKKQQLDTIKNYKKALIFEYVTGKKQV